MHAQLFSQQSGGLQRRLRLPGSFQHTKLHGKLLQSSIYCFQARGACDVRSERASGRGRGTRPRTAPAPLSQPARELLSPWALGTPAEAPFLLLLWCAVACSVACTSRWKSTVDQWQVVDDVERTRQRRAIFLVVLMPCFTVHSAMPQGTAGEDSYSKPQRLLDAADRNSPTNSRRRKELLLAARPAAAATGAARRSAQPAARCRARTITQEA